MTRLHRLSYLLPAALTIGLLGCDGSTAAPDNIGDGIPPEEDAGSMQDDTSAEDTSAEDTSAGDTSIEDTSAEDTGEPDPSLELIADAGLCEIPQRPGLSVRAGQDMHRVTLEDPDALCNDGSPGIFYVSPAPAGSPDADKWVVWLEGGGGCSDATTCAQRWCGEQPPHSAAKMSSSFAPADVEGGGIFDRAPGGGAGENRFAGYNMVMVYYCSSDNWVGRGTQDATGAQGFADYRINFMGGGIVDATFEALKSGVTSDPEAVPTTMPSIDLASQVLFMGTSAGGGGARFNADSVSEQLKLSNPGVDVRLVVDAGFHPSDTPDPPDLTQEQVDAALARKFEDMVDWRQAQFDASCLAFHADDPKLCADNSHLLEHHITTPFFVKMDLSDRVNSPGIYPDSRSFSRAVFALLQDVALRHRETAEEGDAMSIRPGVFAPNCGHHVNLETTAFYNILITDAGDRVARSHHDVLANWLQETEPTTLIHNPEDGLNSQCP